MTPTVRGTLSSETADTQSLYGIDQKETVTFGRTPMIEQGDGRDHNPYGFTMWFAGGGVRGGQTIGTTDEIGLHAVEDRLHVHDLHATVLASLKKTNRMVVVEEGWPTCSVASEITAIVMEDGFDDLDAPVLRVTNVDVPLPYAANLEKLALLKVEDVVEAAKKVCYR